MNILNYIKENRITRTDKVVIKKFRQESFDSKGIIATVYEGRDNYFIRLTLPFDFNEKGVYSIEWGEWLQNIVAVESNAFGVDLLVSVQRGCFANILMNNPAKPYVDPDYPKLPIIAPPNELKLELK